MLVFDYRCYIFVGNREFMIWEFYVEEDVKEFKIYVEILLFLVVY